MSFSILHLGPVFGPTFGPIFISIELGPGALPTHKYKLDAKIIAKSPLAINKQDEKNTSIAH